MSSEGTGVGILKCRAETESEEGAEARPSWPLVTELGRCAGIVGEGAELVLADTGRPGALYWVGGE